MAGNNQAGRPIKPWFGMAIVGFIGCIVAVLLVAILWHRKAEPLPPAMPEGGSKNDWVNYKPSPTPTPVKYEPHRVEWTPPSVPVFHQQAQPQAKPTMSQWERERIERYHKALFASVEVKQDGANVLETNQLAANNKQTPPLSMKELPPHTVPVWSMIYAVLETGIRSDHPSDVLARINQPVRDATLSEVLIPAGCHLHGWQDGRQQVYQTDSSVIVRWDSIQCADREPINLNQMASMDPQGFSGIEGDVDHHYMQIYGQALLISAITAGISLAAHPSYGYTEISPEQQAFGAGAQTMGNRAMGQLNQGLDTHPTITVAPGSLLRVLVNHPLTFDKAFEG